MPLSRTKTRLLAVPRSIPMSLERNPNTGDGQQEDRGGPGGRVPRPKVQGRMVGACPCVLASARPLSIGKPGTPPGEGRPAPAAPHFPGGQEGNPRIGCEWIFEAQAFALPVRRGRGKSG